MNKVSKQGFFELLISNMRSAFGSSLDLGPEKQISNPESVKSKLAWEIESSVKLGYVRSLISNIALDFQILDQEEAKTELDWKVEQITEIVFCFSFYFSIAS